jgi:pyruvate/2-oxoglutarate/acetoin dehydrogenase E1 component
LGKGETAEELITKLQPKVVDTRIGKRGYTGVVIDSATASVKPYQPWSGDYYWSRISTVWDGIARRRKQSNRQIVDWLVVLAYVFQYRNQCHGLTIYGWCPWGGQIRVIVNAQGEVARVDLVWMDGPSCHRHERVLVTSSNKL